MTSTLRVFCFLFCFLYTCVALDVQGRVQWNDICSSASQLGQTAVALNSGKLFSGVKQDGTFTIFDVPVGTYILSILSHDYVFDQFRIDILNSSTTPEVKPFIPGTPLSSVSNVLLPHPIVAVPRYAHDYFVPPPNFNIVGMLSNPMILVMVFGGAMVLAMPYLMKNMDPELVEEVKKQNSAFARGDLKASLSALTSSQEDSRGAPVKGASTGAKSTRSSAKTRRR